jgi:hypothetical protein
MFDAGSAADLHMNLNKSASWLSPVLQTFPPAATGNDGISTSNKFGLAPPPASFDLKAVIVLRVDILNSSFCN